MSYDFARIPNMRIGSGVLTQARLPLSCRTDPLRLGPRRPRVVNRFGGQDEAVPDRGSVTPEGLERRIRVCPGFQASEGRLAKPTPPAPLGQIESRRLSGALELFHERA